MDSQRESLDLDYVRNYTNKFKVSQDKDCICKSKNAFKMVLDHLGNNFNDNEEQRMQFENML